jgi:hypothetical protein
MVQTFISFFPRPLNFVALDFETASSAKESKSWLRLEI